MLKSARLSAILVLFMPGALIAAQSKPAAVSNSSEIAKSDWASYDRDYVGDRYSPLDEIKTDNVTRLQPFCTYDSGVKTSFETGPVVVGGTLYFTTLDTTFAIDADNCKLRWKHTETLTEAQRKGLGVNRGVAAGDGKVFRGYDDGNVVAIDAKSGKALWSTPIAHKDKGETIPAAPLAWNGMVFVGNAGGDNFAVTGRILALDANRSGGSTWFPIAALRPPRGPRNPRRTRRPAEQRGLRTTWIRQLASYGLGPVTLRRTLSKQCTRGTVSIPVPSWRLTPTPANSSPTYSP